MKNFLPALVFFIFSPNIYAQENKVLIKFAPLALIDITMPAIQAGVEFKLTKNISWYNEFGIKYVKGFTDQYTDTNSVSSSGYKLKSEIRYYLPKKNPWRRTYFAANLSFVHDLHNRAITYSQGIDTASKVDNFGVIQNVCDVNFVYGMQQSISKKISIDVYAGVGLRFRNIRTINKEYNNKSDTIQDPIDPKIWEIGESADAKGGFSILPNVTGGIRICYRL